MSQENPPWYHIGPAEGLRQGDVFRAMLAYQLPLELPHTADGDGEGGLDAEYARADWIVMTASCDADTARVRNVLLARIFPADEEHLKAPTAKEHNQRLEVLRQGHINGRFMLAPFPGAGLPSFVDFRTQALMPREYLLRHEGLRLRLVNPIREVFGWWVAAGFGAVGVDNDLQLAQYANIGAVQILEAEDQGP